jgi:uncharacterized cofD-like protein
VAIRLVPAEVEPLPQTLAAIANADLITIGPGSLFTSLAPNLVVRGISQAIAKSRAIKVFVCNLMTEANESLDLSASDHVRVLNRHAGFNNIFGHAAINRTAISIDARSRYAAAGKKQIDPEVKTLERLGIKVIVGDYLEESNGTVRHVSKLVAHDLLTLAIDRRNSASAPQ